MCKCLTLWWPTSSQWFTKKATLVSGLWVTKRVFVPPPATNSNLNSNPDSDSDSDPNPSPHSTVTLIVCFWSPNSATKRCLCLTFSFSQFPPFFRGVGLWAILCQLILGLVLYFQCVFVCFGLVRFSWLAVAGEVSSDSLRLRLRVRIIYCSGCRVVCQKFLCGNLSMNEPCVWVCFCVCRTFYKSKEKNRNHGQSEKYTFRIFVQFHSATPRPID